MTETRERWESASAEVLGLTEAVARVGTDRARAESALREVDHRRQKQMDHCRQKGCPASQLKALAASVAAELYGQAIRGAGILPEVEAFMTHGVGCDCEVQEGDKGGARFVAETGPRYVEGQERLRFRGLVRELVPEALEAEAQEMAGRSERRRKERTSALGDSLEGMNAAERERRRGPLPTGGGWSMPLDV